MFDNSPAFHVNCLRFAAHGLVFSSFNSSLSQASECIKIDLLVAYESLIKNFFNSEYIPVVRTNTLVNTAAFLAACFSLSPQFYAAFRYDASIER